MKSIRCRSRRGSDSGTFLNSSPAENSTPQSPLGVCFPMRPARSVPPAIRTRSNHTFFVHSAQPTLVKNEAGRAVPMLHCLPPKGLRGRILQFENFDEAYLTRLRAGD